MTTCDGDGCDTRVSTTGYLGGEIVCRDCARKRRAELNGGDGR